MDGLGPLRLMSHEGAARPLAPSLEYILRHRKVRRKVQFLVDNGDANLLSVRWAREMNLTPIKVKGSGRGSLGTSDNLH